MGCKDVYVNFIPLTYMQERITLNMYLNRVIQEICHYKTDIDFESEDFFEQLEKLPVLEKPSLVLSKISTKSVNVSNETPDLSLYTQENYLYSKGVRLPILIDSEGNIIMGKTRSFLYINKGIDAPVLTIKKELVPYIVRALRGISNKFNFDDKDYLRTSSRRHIISNIISDDMQEIYGKYKKNHNMSIYVAGVKKRLGNNILDFGAGNGKQTSLLRQYGLNMTLFEPFTPRASAFDEVSILKTKASYENFLNELSKNKPFTTVIANAVLNSVAIKTDLYKIAYLLRVMAIGGVLKGSTRSKIKHFYRGFSLDDSTRLTSGMGKLKVQNFIDENQLKDIFKLEDIKTKIIDAYLMYEIKEDCLEVDMNYLNKAIDLEFNFLYTDRRLDYSEQAKDIIGARIRLFASKGLCKILKNT